MANLNGRKKTGILFADTENTYTYDGADATYEYLDELSTTLDDKGKPLIDYSKIGVGRVLFGMCDLESDEVKFLDGKEFSDLISGMTGNNIIYFFNLSYDINYFGKVLNDAGFVNTKNLINMGSIISLEFRSKNISISLRDVRKFTGGSLKSAGEMFACTRKKMDFPITCAADLDLPIVREYLSVDVLLLKEIYVNALALVQGLQKDLGVTVVSRLPLTAGSCAINMITEKGYPVSKKMKFKNLKSGFQKVFGMVDTDIDGWFRKFYYGALGACNMPTTKPVGKKLVAGYVKEPIYVDYKSMYPYQMADKEFPIYGNMKKYNSFIPVNADYRFAFYVVKLHDVGIKKGRYPSVVVGKGHKDDVSLLTSAVDTHIYLIDHHGTRSDWKNFLKDYVGDYTVEETVLCRAVKFSPGWIEYLNTLYLLKDSPAVRANKGLYSLIKLLLNSIYGKIGQNMAHRRNELLWVDEIEKYKLVELDTFDIETESQLSVAIASCITMYARNDLLTVVDEFGAQNVMLTATDAVIALNNPHTQVVLKKLLALKPLNETTMGMLDVDEIDKLALYGTKAYQYIKKDGKLVNKQAGLSEKTKNALPWLYPNVSAVVNQKKAKAIVGGRYLALTTFKFAETPYIQLNNKYQEEVIYE